MRNIDERVAAVQRRSKRLRKRHGERVLAVLACLMALPLIDLAGRYAAGGLALPPDPDGGLFGAASLFGSSAGGYVLVAVVAAVVAVAITVLLMVRRGSRNEADGKGDHRLHSDYAEEREGASDEE